MEKKHTKQETFGNVHPGSSIEPTPNPSKSTIRPSRHPFENHGIEYDEVQLQPLFVVGMYPGSWAREYGRKDLA